MTIAIAESTSLFCVRKEALGLLCRSECSLAVFIEGVGSLHRRQGDNSMHSLATILRFMRF